MNALPLQDTMKLCQHCRRRIANRPRGLCALCFLTPGVRDRYPCKKGGGARRGVGNGNRRQALPDRPTPFPPGSPEKVAVLCERAAEGVSLWHPRDARVNAA